MALSFSGLTAYTKQNVKPLLTSAVLGATTQKMIVDNGIVLTGVKGPTQIPLMDTDAFFQVDGCGYSPSGTTTFSGRVLTPGKIRVEETICPKDLEQYFTMEILRAGSTYTDFGTAEFAAAYLAKKNARIAAQLETAIWQGSTASATANLNKFDGLSTLINAGSPVDANVSAYTGVATITTVTQSNVIAATEGLYKAIPAQVLSKGDAKIFVGDDWFRLLVMAYRAEKLFLYQANETADRRFVLPATSVEVVAVNGLNTTGDAYAMSLSNMVLGLDLESEHESYKLWYSEDQNEIRSRVAFKLGVNVAFTAECVKFVAGI
jgi:hypothetical protein